MDTVLQQFITLLGSGRVFQDEDMSMHVSFRTGGRATVYVEVEKIEELISAIALCREAKLQYKILGSGTSMVVSDKGFDGVIIKNNSKRFEVMTMLGTIRQQHMSVDTAILYAESGANMNQVVRYSIEQGLSGLEYQLGLPGTVGGAVYTNAQYSPKKAFIGDSIKSARILTATGEIHEVDSSYFSFGFDTSSLQQNDDVVLSVQFSLTPENKQVLWDRGMQASTLRSQEQPTSEGYTYRNMEVTSSDEEYIIQPDISDILQEADIASFQQGGVKLSEKRYNYLINTGEADTDTLVEFINKVKARVQDKTGATIRLETYVVWR